MLTVSRSCFLLLTGLTAAHAVDLPLSAKNVHWGFFSKTLEPVLTVDSGTEVKVEMATHHACDDYDKVSLESTHGSNEWNKVCTPYSQQLPSILNLTL
jgi:hypothetical protein